MIIKSMSRKEASFGQLIDYIDRDGGEERYRVRYNLFGRDRERIREEFEQNAEHMPKRKNGVFMYHEIISLTRARGIPLEAQKERLHQIAQEYMAARAPRNLCYGGLHDDKNHSLHYHLMISANRAGEAKRHRLSKEQFRTIQISLERFVLETYPELEQAVSIEKSADAPLPHKEAELKRRGGRASRREEVSQKLEDALNLSRDRESLLAALSKSKLELYVRGQSLGVKDHQTGKRHRIKSLSAELVPALTARMEQVQETRTRDASYQSGRFGSQPDFSPADEKEKPDRARVEPEVEAPREAVSESELSEVQRRWKQEAQKEAARELEERKRQRGEDDERQR